MGHFKKKLGVLKRSMAVTLSLVLVSSCLGIQSAPPTVVKADTTAIVDDFETDTRHGNPMGDVKLTSSDGALLVSNRTQDWNSYCYNLKDYIGKSFNFSAKMRVDGDNLGTVLGVVCVKTNTGGDDIYTWIASQSVTSGQYITLDAKYAVPANSSICELYFCTYDYAEEKGTTHDFYLDDISIKETLFLKEDFNKLTTISELIGQPMGNPTLGLIDENKNDKALEVSNRTSNYFGYSYNLEAFAGYKISLKATISASNVAEDVGSEFKATLKIGEDYKQAAIVTTTGSAIATLECSEYELEKGASGYLLYFEGPENVTFVLDDIEIAVVGDYAGSSSEISYVDTSQYKVLKDLYSDYFTMGVACEAIKHWGNQLSEIGNPAKEQLIKSQFNSITFGNELKPDYNMGYKSEDATETYLPYVVNPAAKEMLDWAVANDMPVRGHTLVWHSQCPDAVFCKDYTPVYLEDGKTLDASCFVDRTVMLQRMESYIYSAMKYMYENGYAETIYAWDVVNEAVEQGWNEYGLRNSYWYQVIGNDFVYYAFKYAKEAVNQYSVEYASKYKIDPTDKEALDRIQPSLFYNDYNEFQESKCTAIIDMVTRNVDGQGSMVSNGYIDGIGMQGHLSDNTNIATFITAMKRYDAAVDEVQITELDVSQTTTGVNAQYYQAKFYKEFFEALIKAVVEDKVNLNCVTIWGLTDDNSWKKETSPLIFKADLSKKLAFDGIAGAADGTELPAPAYVAPDFKDMDATFDATDATVESEGFSVRGSGTLTLQSDVVYNGSMALHDSGRTANWNGVSFDVSRFIGQTIQVSAWVKSNAPEVKLSADIDGSWPNLASIDTSDGEWKQMIAEYKVPSDMTALKLYFEGSTLDDLYIDSVKVKLLGLNEDFEGTVNIASARGVGHVPSFAGVTKEQSHNVSGQAFLVKRTEQDATMKFDVSKYIGHTIDIKAYVKTSDAKIRLGFDADTPVILTQEDAVADGWTQVSATYKLSKDLTSASMYIETDGSADFYVDDISVVIADFVEDCEGSSTILTTRWGGAGTLNVVEDGSQGNHAAVLTERTANYMGIAFDVTSYIGMDVLVSMDVKTEDSRISLTGDIDGSWPNYLNTTSDKGQYKTIHAAIKLPKDLSTLRLYVETDGTSDLYVDNVTIKRIPVGKELKFTFDMNGHGTALDPQLITEKGYAYQVSPAKVEDYEFGGWYKESSCTTPWDFASDIVTAPTTVYAKWIQTGASVDPIPEPVNPTPSTPVVTTPSVPEQNLTPTYTDSEDLYKVTMGVATENVTAKNNVIRKSLEAGKDVQYAFMKDNKLQYSITFKAELYNPSVKLSNVKLGITFDSAKELNHEEGMLVSMEHTGKLAMEASVKVNAGSNFKAGDTAYLYKYNKDTKKLECQPNNKYIVGSDSYVNLNIISGGDYVLLPSPAAGNEKKGFLSQVEVDKKLELRVGQANQEFISFPDFFALVPSLEDFDASINLSSIGTTVTFRSNKNKIVSVDENGKLWAIRKGTCKVAAIVETSTGKKVKYVTTITVK